MSVKRSNFPNGRRIFQGGKIAVFMQHRNIEPSPYQQSPGNTFYRLGRNKTYFLAIIISFQIDRKITQNNLAPTLPYGNIIPIISLLHHIR